MGRRNPRSSRQDLASDRLTVRAARWDHTATQLPSGRVLVVDGFANTSPGQHGAVRPSMGTGLEQRRLYRPTQSGVTRPRSCPRARFWWPGGGGGDGGSSAELYGISFRPAQVSLAAGAKQTFTARGGSGLGYAWSFVHNESGGTLTASGDYQAGPVGGVTDVLQVVDSFANSSTATVNVLRQAAAVSTTAPQAKSMGCGDHRWFRPAVAGCRRPASPRLALAESPASPHD